VPFGSALRGGASVHHDGDDDDGEPANGDLDRSPLAKRTVVNERDRGDDYLSINDNNDIR
jgi:hypothetical protein